MKHIIQWFRQTKVKVFVLLPFYFFIFLPLSAQVGTWKNYLSYYQVQDICEAGGELFVLASNGLYQYNLNDQSIITYDKTNSLSDTYITHIAWNKQAQRLIAVYKDSNIDLVEKDGDVINISSLYSKSMTEDKTVKDVRIDGIYAYLVTDFAIIKVNMQKAEITETYTKDNPDYPSTLPEKSHADYEKYISLVSTLSPGGPAYNFFYESKLGNGRLYTTGGYFLSGMPDPQRPGIIQVFDGENWTLYEEEINKKTGYDYKDINCIDYDPTDVNHVFAGGRCGLYEFRNGKLVNYYNKDNSPLKGATDRGKELDNQYVLIPAVKFDSKGHLWVLNGQAKNVSLLELDTDGKWISHHHTTFADENNVSLPSFCSMFIDSRGLLWFVNNNWFDPSVFCYDMENDIALKYNGFTNQDGLRYKVNWVYTACEDRKGNIWVGTDLGPFLINKDEIGKTNITFYQVKVPRNDGTDYADYLLSGVSISSIAVDGGNRKWFGTNGAGAFLISADNYQQIHNFTTSNSKLITNSLSSIAINHQSGEVFFLSDEGLCSYQSDATTPNDDMTKDNVYAYPNPVTPDYSGLITIVGLSYDADIKIAASNGAIIAEGRSNGGMFTWDGCDKKGRRVASGVYMVMTATSDGKSGTVCKIAVIN